MTIDRKIKCLYSFEKRVTMQHKSVRERGSFRLGWFYLTCLKYLHLLFTT